MAELALPKDLPLPRELHRESPMRRMNREMEDEKRELLIHNETAAQMYKGMHHIVEGLALPAIAGGLAYYDAPYAAALVGFVAAMSSGFLITTVKDGVEKIRDAVRGIKNTHIPSLPRDEGIS